VARFIVRLDPKDYTLYCMGAFQKETATALAVETYRRVAKAIENMHVTAACHGLDLAQCVEIQEETEPGRIVYNTPDLAQYIPSKVE